MTDNRRSRRFNSTRGSALLAVLWLSAGLAAIGFAVSSTVRSETERVSTSAEGLRAWYLATGAVERGMQWMAWGGAYRNADGSPRFWQDRAPRLNMEFPSGAAVIEVIPEAAKLNINLASPEDLNRVVLAVSGDPEQARQIVEGILDWRAPPADGASDFDPYYFSIRPTFHARHASFQEIEELLLVRGMTPELFYGNYTTDASGVLYARGGLRDCLSVWGSEGPFDVNSASPALMESMGTPPDIVTAIMARRAERPFASQQELALMGSVAPRLGVNIGFTIYTLRATARLKRADGSFSDVVRTASATVKLLDRKRALYPLQVLRWYDDAWSQAIVPPDAATLFSGGNTEGLSPQ